MKHPSIRAPEKQNVFDTSMRMDAYLNDVGLQAARGLVLFFLPGRIFFLAFFLLVCVFFFVCFLLFFFFVCLFVLVWFFLCVCVFLCFVLFFLPSFWVIHLLFLALF